MSLLWIAAVALWLVAGASTGLTLRAILERVEEGFDPPVDGRPSPFRRRELVGEYLRIHRRMYPRSRLRLWLWISMAVNAALFLGFAVFGLAAHGRPG